MRYRIASAPHAATDTRELNRHFHLDREAAGKERIGTRASSRFLVFAVSQLLSARASLPERTAIPAAALSSAHLAGLPRARFWGDEVTPEIKAVITEQYQQVKDAARVCQVK